MGAIGWEADVRIAWFILKQGHVNRQAAKLHPRNLSDLNS